jgi:hypothetical protein
LLFGHDEVAHLGRNMWQNKTAHIMARKWKKEKEEVTRVPPAS